MSLTKRHRGEMSSPAKRIKSGSVSSLDNDNDSDDNNNTNSDNNNNANDANDSDNDNEPVTNNNPSRPVVRSSHRARSEALRKRQHQKSDKQRRAKIKEGMDQLKSLVSMHGKLESPDQASIVSASVDLVHSLRAEISALKQQIELEQTKNNKQRQRSINYQQSAQQSNNNNNNNYNNSNNSSHIKNESPNNSIFPSSLNSASLSQINSFSQQLQHLNNLHSLHQSQQQSSPYINHSSHQNLLNQLSQLSALGIPTNLGAPALPPLSASPIPLSLSSVPMSALTRDLSLSSASNLNIPSHSLSNVSNYFDIGQLATSPTAINSNGINNSNIHHQHQLDKSILANDAWN